MHQPAQRKYIFGKKTQKKYDNVKIKHCIKVVR